MILVDTSVWVDHLRAGAPALAVALEQGSVLMHPFVLGELACGNLKNRGEVLRLLGELPAAPMATDPEALNYIERRALMAGASATLTSICSPRSLSPAPRACGRGTSALLRWRLT